MYEMGSLWKEHISHSVQLKVRSVYKNVRIICASHPLPLARIIESRCSNDISRISKRA
jgi:hypothetical protein